MSIKVIGSEVRSMFGSIAHRYDLTNSVLSFGIHHLWRWRLVHQVSPNPQARALDLCSGTGDLVPLLERRFGAVMAADFCFPMMKHGREKFKARKAVVPRFIQSDALRLPFQDGSFEVITVAFGVRNLEDLKAGLKEIRRVLSIGGHALILEFGQPKGIFFAPIFRWYSRFLMPMIGGLLTGNRDAYTYLPATSRTFPCGEDFVKIFEECGFKSTSTVKLNSGIAYIYAGRRDF